MICFTHLHVHSSFSPGWGVCSLSELCTRAKALGMSRIALTDRNGLYGVPYFIEQAQAAGIAPIIGSEAVTSRHRAVLLARTQEGYANLCRLLSELHCRNDFDLPAVLATCRRGLVILSDDSDVLSALASGGREHLYVELSPGHAMPGGEALARRLNLPVVATSRAVLIHPDDFHLHRVRRAIALNRKLSSLPEAETACESDLLRSASEMADFYPHCPEALENAQRIAESCRTDWDFSGTIFPTYRGLDEKDAYAELEQKARAGAKRRYGQLTEAVESRLVKELAIIRTKGFAHYFLVVEELAARCPRTCGRGSAAASLVAYSLGITHVDPLRYNLFFERFLNPERVDPPDIDIDFPWDERDEVLDFAFSRYGAWRAAMVANQVGFGGRGALREVAKVYGFPEQEIKALTGRLSHYWNAEASFQAVEEHPLFQGDPPSPEWREVFQTARRLEGHLRHLSLHCGGLVVVPDDLRRYVPVEVAAKGVPVIQWEKDQTEAAGLVKIDLLGNRSLAVIRDTLEAVEKNTGRYIDYESWRPLEDRKTRELLCGGQTMGCFYIESPATRQLLRKMWLQAPALPEPDVLFEHLVMASSIIRPAANPFIRQFIARMRGALWQALHPALEKVLDETYGIAIYQEQITQMAMALAGFSPADGDQLRKIISKKHKGKKLESYRRLFFEGALRRGVAEDVVEKVWAQILSFGGYSFCKPHSASYALVSCKCAWLKAHNPAEFMAAVISNGGGYYTPLAYLSECRRMGLKVLPPDINQSDWAYKGKGRSVRVGLMQVGELSRRGVQALLDERAEGGAFSGFDNFLQRTALGESDVRQLIKAGCFDALEGRHRRSELLWVLLSKERSVPSETPSLFDEPAPKQVPALPNDTRQTLRQEVETLGFLTSCHPLVPYRRVIAEVNRIEAAALSQWVGRYVILVGWWVTGKTVQTCKGQPMEFITFEDTSAIFETTFFPRAYALFCQKLSRQRPYVLKGRVEAEFGVPTLTVEWVNFLGD